MITETEKRQATGLRSMTGFAQALVRADGFVLSVSLRSVNHRSLDIHLHLPEQLQSFEAVVRKQIAGFQPRGHLQLKVMLESEAGAGPALDEELIGKYLDLFRRVGERYGLQLETAIQALSQVPGAITGGGPPSTAPIPQRLEAAFRKALSETLDAWDEMRGVEGALLAEDLRSRTLRIAGCVERLEQMHQRALPAAQSRLRERLQSWLGQHALDETRLVQEAAALAEHTDISEEVLRLKAHFAQFLAMLDGNGEAGKKLDFLLQEIQREVNTLLAKTAGLGESGLPMTQTALDIKGEAEKLREQVQNVQ